MHVIIAQVLSYELPRAHSEDSDRSALQTLFHVWSSAVLV